MTLDASTRNRLQKTVTACRRLLTADFNLQLQRDYGIYADEGKVFPLEKLVSQDDRTLHTGRLLRERIDHLKASEPEEREPLKHAVDRVLREQAFTVLNRFAALRMAEERGLIQLSVGKGFQSDAFLVFDNFAGAALGSQYDRYRLFFSCLVDELSLDLGVLFDRHSPFGLLFPSAEALGQLFDALNAPDIRPLWKADETIGWIYQYYNDEVERRKMRESAAPRNSRELAVRNQFFTPRYVVEFLTDNTLGRIWYEMRQGDTSLKDKCHYLVRRPKEIFLSDGQSSPEENQAQDTGKGEVPQEDLLRQPVNISYRPLKDPREIRLLDPACGSMHFGLYAFDLFEIIYREAWNLPDLRRLLAEAYGYADPGEVIAAPESVKLRPKAKVQCFASGREVSAEEAVVVLARYEKGHIAGRPLIYHPEEVASRRTSISLEMPLRAFSYDRAIQENWFSPVAGKIFLETAGCFSFQAQPARTLEEAFVAFQQDIPRLIIERNIHGIDIDPRCAQIAGLSLWLRAQKSWQDMKLRSLERPVVRKSNIVCAEPMPGEKELLGEFVEQQFPASERPAFAFLLEKIFDSMTLAGEAGSLLCIEEEIRTAIADAKRLWKEGPKTEQAPLFSKSGETMGQSAMRLDLSGINDEQFWERAELGIYDALKIYAEQTANGGGFQRRLFADDAAQGFAFIDVCRKRFDVVVMNPPFGESATGAKDYIASRFPRTKNDVYAAFVEQGIHRLIPRGLLGAITSRSGFFLTSFQKWREEILLDEAKPLVIADLGSGVLDSATVETAGYVLESSKNFGTDLIWYRLISEQDKGSGLLESIGLLYSGVLKPNAGVLDPRDLRCIPGSPFAYWVSNKIRQLFVTLERMESQPREIRIGPSTGDDTRYVRIGWEVPVEQIGREHRWVWLNKGGTASPFYFDYHLVIDWDETRHTFRGFIGRPGRPIERPNGLEHFFRPGISWPLRTQAGFNTRVVPEGLIFSHKGPTIFAPSHQELLALLAVTRSRIFQLMVGLQISFGSYEVGAIQRTVVPICDGASSAHLAALSSKAWSLSVAKHTADETARCFTFPLGCFDIGKTIRSLHEGAEVKSLKTRSTIADIEKSIDAFVLNLYGLEEADVKAPEASKGSDSEPSETVTDESEDSDAGETEISTQESISSSILSYAFGCVFGRWDIRYATHERLKPMLPEPFAPLPVCSPGMLQGADGLPLPLKEGRELYNAGNYPLDVAWDGILVDDPDHTLDIERCVRAALQVFWGQRADEAEQEACSLLGMASLRQWFRRPAGFFADHLSRYSKSRRQAPIYWPLSTRSGGYTLWLYYHRLDDQTLFQCVNHFIDPKLIALEKDLVRLRKEPEGKQIRQIEEADTLRLELEEMKVELLRVAALQWKPNLNDGVLITASPLWRLFRLPKWQKDLKKCWQELERGDYDWAHLAYTLWPDRVKKVCENDRSISITHGLEHLCKVEAPKPAKKRGKMYVPVEIDEVK